MLALVGMSAAADAAQLTIPVGSTPTDVAVSPDGATAYVTNNKSGTVSVTSTASNTVTATFTVGSGPFDVALNPGGTSAYVTNYTSGTVSVIDTASNTVTATITGVAYPRRGSRRRCRSTARAPRRRGRR